MPVDQPPGFRWLQDNWESLRPLNFQWVAARGDGVIASAPDLPEVMNEVIRLELTEQAVYAFIDFVEYLQR